MKRNDRMRSRAGWAVAVVLLAVLPGCGSEPQQEYDLVLLGSADG
jgi:hypothetical protein